MHPVDGGAQPCIPCAVQPLREHHDGEQSVDLVDAGRYFRPLEDFASDETEQKKLYWTDEPVVVGANPLVRGGKNSGKAVGGSTVHFAMVSLRFGSEWLRSRW